MAFTYGFYNSVDHDRRYDAVQMGQIFDGIITDGIYEHYKDGLKVAESSRDDEVIVKPGRAWFNHTWSFNDNDMPLHMPDPEVALERIDAVVLDINARIDVRANSIGWIKGTPAARNPQPPTLVRSETNNQYALAYVHRYAGQHHIYTRDIESRRGLSPDCPFVNGAVENFSVNNLIDQWWAQFDYELNRRIAQYDAWKNATETDFAAWRQARENEFFTWLESEKTAYAQFLSHNTTAWTNWFSHIQYELDGDVAGHLQNQIDRISYMYVIDNVLYLPNTGASISGNRLILTNHN